MSRTIIRMQANPIYGDTDFCLEIAPPSIWPIPNAGNLLSLGFQTMPPILTNMHLGALVPYVVRDAGLFLYNQLSIHPAIKQAIESALRQRSLQPIYIYLQSDMAEEVPWEILCNPNNNEFLSLDRCWPIGRIIDSSALAIERAVELPFRMTVVLAAADLTARYEWEAFYNAACTANFEIDLQVFVYEDALKHDISLLTPPTKVKVKELHFVPNKQDIQVDLFDPISLFAPNILHFFCHGSTTPNSHLELASRAYCTSKSINDLIHIEADQLWQGTQLEQHTWLVTLNCCDSTARVAKAHPLARDLVAKGFPAVIGMREVVASIDAHAFCEAFYRALFDEIKYFLMLGKDGIIIEWPKLLHKPRTHLRNQHMNGRTRSKADGETKEWTLPVIYVRSGDFRLRGPSTNKNMSESYKLERQVELNQLKEARQSFDSGTPFGDILSNSNRFKILEDELYP